MTSTEKPPPETVNKRAIVIVVAAVALVAAFVTTGGVDEVLRRLGRMTGADVEIALKQVEELPLVRLVIKENPSVDVEFRKAIEAEREHPTTSGPTRMFLVGAEVRKRYIVPALGNADDQHALAAVKLLQELTLHLQKTSPDTCFEFGKIGLQRPDKLDEAGRAIFKRALAAQEDAYLNGKAAKDKRPLPSQLDVTRALTEAGYTPDDFRKLSGFAALSETDGCAATVKLYSAPAQLPAEHGAPVARYLLTVAP